MSKVHIARPKARLWTPRPSRPAEARAGVLCGRAEWATWMRGWAGMEVRGESASELDSRESGVEVALRS